MPYASVGAYCVDALDVILGRWAGRAFGAHDFDLGGPILPTGVREMSHLARHSHAEMLPFKRNSGNLC